MGESYRCSAPVMAHPETVSDPTGEQQTPRHPVLRVVWIVVIALALTLSSVTGFSLGQAFADRGTEPVSVVVGTWMRDHGLGPLVAQLETFYYQKVKPPEIGGAPDVSADLGEDDTTASPAPSALPTELPTAAPTSTPSPSSTAAHLAPPPNIVSPADDPQPMEGVWQPVGSKVAGQRAMYATRVRADDVHTKYYATALWIDPTLARAMYIPGYEEPSAGPNPYDGALPKELWPLILANTNGAFRLEGSQGGYIYDGDVIKPMTKGRATAVITADGALHIGKWGRDFDTGDGVVVARQNLNLIVDKGESKVASSTDNIVWGATTDKESLAWRSAIGERADGSLVYVIGEYLSAAGLADTLVRAGVERAMVLDMNLYWSAGFTFRHKKDGTPVCRKLDPAISDDCNRFLNRYKRDSFQFLARSPIGASPTYSSTTP